MADEEHSLHALQSHIEESHLPTHNHLLGLLREADADGNGVVAADTFQRCLTAAGLGVGDPSPTKSSFSARLAPTDCRLRYYANEVASFVPPPSAAPGAPQVPQVPTRVPHAERKGVQVDVRDKEAF